jgi:hypothetical protein
MLGWRTLLVVLLVLFHVGLAATVTLLSVDFAWAPSYFDDDGDFLPTLLAEQVPALPDLGSWVPALTLLAALAAWMPRGSSRLTSARVRFRAPPRP